MSKIYTYICQTTWETKRK